MAATPAPIPLPSAISEPYPPSWFSRLFAWMDRLPGHGWWVAPLLAVVLVAWAHGVLWVSGRLPFGTIEPLTLVWMVYGPYTLAVVPLVHAVARRALAEFWPATGWPESERPTWEHRLVTSPGGYGAVALVFGVVVSMVSTLSASTASLGSMGGDVPVAMAAMLPMSLLGYSLFPAVVIHTIHQLRLVARIHREATAVNPFDRVPLYAFSRVTALAGLAYVGLGYYSLTVNGAFQAGNLASLATLAASFAFGIACFVIPLWGIHGRLELEKERLLREVEVRANAVAGELYRRIDAGDFESTKAMADGYAGVAATRHRIEQLPTWPWPPQLLRGFITALLLPVAVYLLTRVAGTVLGG